MGVQQPLQVVTQDDLKLVEGFIEDFLEFSRNRAKKLRDIEKKVRMRFGEVAKTLKKLKAKTDFRENLESKILGFETRRIYMLEVSLKDSKTRLYLSVAIPMAVEYTDKTYSPGLVHIELFKSYPGQLTGGVLKSLSPVRRDVFRGEAVSAILVHTDAFKIDKENKILGLLSAFNQELLGFRDNIVFACQYSRGNMIAKRTVIIIPLLVWIYYRNKKEWRREYEHTEQISCTDLCPRLNLSKLSGIEYRSILAAAESKNDRLQHSPRRPK